MKLGVPGKLMDKITVRDTRLSVNVPQCLNNVPKNPQNKIFAFLRGVCID